MEFEFVRPVHIGETITCTWRTTSVEECEDRYELVAEIGCVNEDGAAVLDATVDGIVRKDGI